MKVRLTLFALLLLIAFPVMAQDDPVTPAELDLSGTPDAICDAATPAVDPVNREYTEAAEVIEADVDYRAIFCTSAGAVYIDLFEEYTPETVNNFVFLAEENYYNNTTFHRVIEEFMAQAGDPTGTGSGGPGYRFDDEIVGFLAFDRPGLLAMANAGPGTNGSQFFITTVETPWLNGAHTIFGEVLEGQAETVDNILIRDPQAGGDATTLDTVVIIRDPEAVETTFEESATIATADDILAGLTEIEASGTLPPDLTFSAMSLETADVTTNTPPTLTDIVTDLLEGNNHEFRVTSTIANSECSADYFFSMMTYTVDAFATAEDATAAIESGVLDQLYETIGFAAVEGDTGGIPAYIGGSAVCGEGETRTVIILQRGRYVAFVDVAYPAAVVGELSDAEIVGVTATNVTSLFESTLGAAYRSELR